MDLSMVGKSVVFRHDGLIDIGTVVKVNKEKGTYGVISCTDQDIYSVMDVIKADRLKEFFDYMTGREEPSGKLKLRGTLGQYMSAYDGLYKMIATIYDTATGTLDYGNAVDPRESLKFIVKEIDRALLELTVSETQPPF